MGLRERKLIAELQEQKFPMYAHKIQDALGVPVTIEADFQHVQDDSRLIDRVELYGIKPLTDALLQTAQDETGKTALAAAVQQITLLLEPDFPGDPVENVAYVLRLSDGTLHLHFAKSGRGLGTVSYYKDDLEKILRLRVQREAASIKNTTLPEQAQKLTEAFGKPMTVAVQWDTTTTIEKQDDMRALRQGIEQSVIAALLQLATDDFARQAVAESLDGVVFLHQPRDQEKQLRTNNRVLEVHAHWRSGGTWEEAYTNMAYTREALENVL